MAAMFADFDSTLPPAELARAVFLDKDGTLIDEIPHNVDPERVRFSPHAVNALRLLTSHGFHIVVVSNQPGLAFGLYTRAQLSVLHMALREMLEREGIPLLDFYTCAHAAGTGPVPACLCRKPAPGLLRQAARSHGLDLSRSWMIGDLLDDVEAGRRAGCQTILLDVGHETAWKRSPLRTPHHRAANLLHAAQWIVSQETSAMPAIPAVMARPSSSSPGEASIFRG